MGGERADDDAAVVGGEWRACERFACIAAVVAPTLF